MTKLTAREMAILGIGLAIAALYVLFGTKP